jgi:hypothetical protein
MIALFIILYWLNIYEWNENVKQTQTCKRETQHQASAQMQQQDLSEKALAFQTQSQTAGRKNERRIVY